MKVVAFHAGDGDCLLLKAGDRNMLVDGGRKTPWLRYAAPWLEANLQALDLVVVSHVDDDHISGIVAMTEARLAWRAFDWQRDHAPEMVRRPRHPRPPAIEALWHNAFATQVDGVDLVQATGLLGATAEMALAHPTRAVRLAGDRIANLANGVQNGLRLAHHLSFFDDDFALNTLEGTPLDGGALLARPAPLALGDFAVRVLGPTQPDLDALQDHWRAWVRDNRDKLRKLRGELADLEKAFGTAGPELSDGDLGDRGGVTPPNLASILLLVEADGRTVLLTGDGHAADIERGLSAHGRVDGQGRCHVDLLKIPHHGAEFNADEGFFQRITADHYLFCANGAHDNPDPRIVQALLDARQGEACTLWFTTSPLHPTLADNTTRRAHMGAIQARVNGAAGVSARFLGDPGESESHFEIDLPP